MNQEEVESQLSAMFDGELPAAECELLSRRLDRDEALRARWSRYALIGAAMRSEPVATARSGFAARVSEALHADQPAVVPAPRAKRAPRRVNRLIWNSALAASMVAAVAGLSISMLRNNAALQGSESVAVRAPTAAVAPAVQVAATDAPVTVLGGDSSGASREPVSYVTPAANARSNMALRTQLADYIVAHSEYSSPLMRRNLLSALVSSEAAADGANGSGANVRASEVHATAATTVHGR